jgi:transposase
MIRFGKTVRKHMDGIVRAISERRSNAFAEGLNSGQGGHRTTLDRQRR